MIFLPLNSQHDRKGFDCGNDDLNSWFHQVARQHKERGVSSTFVAVFDNPSAEVLGYYAITVAELMNVDLPEQYRKRLPERIPVLKRLRRGIEPRLSRFGGFLLLAA